MKKTFKKVIASVLAVTTMAVSALSMNANAYWATIPIDDSSNKAIGEGYLAVSTRSVYARTTRYYNYTMSTSIDYVHGNLDTSRKNSGFSNDYNSYFIQLWGTNITQAKSTHGVNGHYVPIIMGSES